MDWKRKLTSRKFWVAVASFVSMLVVAFGGAEAAATQVTALIMAGASVIAYIIGEGLVDAKGNTDKDPTDGENAGEDFNITDTNTPADSGVGMNNPIGFAISNKEAK